MLAKFLYSVSVVHCAFLAILYLSLVNIGDNTLLFLLSAILRQSFDVVMADPFPYYLQAYFAKTVELTIAALIRAWGKHRFYKRTSFRLNYLKLSIFPIIFLFCSITLLQTFIIYPSATPQLLLCTITLLVSDIIIITLLDQFETQQQNLLDNRLLRRELELAHRNIVTLSASYSNERKLTHDFQNKLTVIQGLLHQSQTGPQTLDYVDQLLNQEYVSALAISTHRNVADVLLNQKYAVAIQAHINFRVQLDDLSNFPLPDDALVVVLSNLIDNAIEACEKIIDSSNRYILIKARILGGEYILYIENSVSSPVKISHDHIATTKNDTFQHGYGLQNVFSIIETYGGIYAMNCENLRFSFAICFNEQN